MSRGVTDFYFIPYPRSYVMILIETQPRVSAWKVTPQTLVLHIRFVSTEVDRKYKEAVALIILISKMKLKKEK